MLTFWRFELLRSSTNGKKTIFCLIQSAMPGRTIREANPAPARGVLRWGNEERLLLHRLFRLHETSPNDGDAMDASRIHDVVYLGTVHQRHPLFRRHAKKNFYQNARRAAAEYLSDKARRGARRRVGGGESSSIVY